MKMIHFLVYNMERRKVMANRKGIRSGTSSCFLQAVAMAAALAGAVAGCATAKVAPVETPTASAAAFLGKDFALLTPGDIGKGQSGLRYFNPKTQWRNYSKIIIEPVTFWGDATGKISPPDQQALATYFRGAMEKEFAERFQLVEMPAPGVMRLQVAITDAEAANPGLRTVSLVVPQVRILNAVQSMATGKMVFAGGLQAEMKLTDAMTGETLCAAVGRGLGGGSIKAAGQWKWGDAENAMDLFAKRGAANLYGLTSGAATPADLPLPDK